jgi:anti-sigma regulatory factor (Ser/Thr protein kinase)
MEQRFQYRSVIQEVPAIRRNLSALKVQWEIPKSEFKQILFIAEELFSNIIRYAFEDTREHIVELAVKKGPDHIILEFIDDGIPFDPLNYRQAGHSDPAATESGGMGLSLVRTFSDSISYQRIQDKNHLEITKWIKSMGK